MEYYHLKVFFVVGEKVTTRQLFSTILFEDIHWKNTPTSLAYLCKVITCYFQPVRNALSRLSANWTPDNLRHDTYSKKRENRPKRLPPSNQPGLTGYLSLRQTFSNNT